MPFASQQPSVILVEEKTSQDHFPIDLGTSVNSSSCPYQLQQSKFIGKHWFLCPGKLTLHQQGMWSFPQAKE